MIHFIQSLAFAAVIFLAPLPPPDATTDFLCGSRARGCQCGTTCPCGEECAARCTPNVGERLQAATVILRGEGGQGSGILVQSRGVVYVLTVAHVCECVAQEEGGYGTMEVLLHNGSVVEGEVVFSHQASDVGLLRTSLRPGSVATVEIERRASRVGDTVLHIGSPRGFQGSVTQGIVSFVGRTRRGEIFDQTSSPATFGSSGGAIVTPEGRLLGLVSHGDPQCIVFYVPTWRVRHHLQGTAFSHLIP